MKLWKRTATWREVLILLSACILVFAAIMLVGR